MRPGIARSSIALASVVLFLFMATAAHAVPPTINSIAPNQLAEGAVPQPTITIAGSNFVVGFPSPTNRPTVTLQHTSLPKVQYSILANVNAAGTIATIPPGNNQFNLLLAPLGAYDVIVTRPDNETDTLEGGFSIITAPEPSGIHFDVASYWGGPIRDIEIVGDLAYVANGSVLRILNIADPANITEVGSIYLHSVDGVAVRDGFAYVSAGAYYKFCVVDVSNPADPRLVWHANTVAPRHGSVQLRGDYAYVNGGKFQGGVEVFNIADPYNVIDLGDLGIPNVYAVTSLRIVGDRLYAPMEELGSPINGVLRIFDLAANPIAPPLLGELVIPDGVNGVDYNTGFSVEGNRACWTYKHPASPYDTVLRVVDVTNPASPQFLAEVAARSASHVFRDVALINGFAFVADSTSDDVAGPFNWNQSQGVVVYNVGANPSNPPLVGTFKTHGNVVGIEIVGNRAYVFDDGEGLIVLDVSNPLNLVRLGNYHSPAELRKMDKVGDLLYVADAWNGFTVLDVADPAHPDVVGVYLAAHEGNRGVDAWGIDVQGNVAYLDAGFLGLEAVDVSDPANPSLLSAYRPSGSYVVYSNRFRGLAVSGDTAFVGWIQTCGPSSINWLLKLNVADPQAISYLSQTALTGCGEVSGAPRAVALSPDQTAFIANARTVQVGCGGNTDVTVSVSNSVIHAGTSQPIVDVALDDDTLFLAHECQNQGILIRDVTNPASPVQLAAINAGFSLPNGEQIVRGYAVAAQNQRLYAIVLHSETFEAGLFVFDVSNPSEPVFLDKQSFVGQGLSSSVYVDEPHFYVNGALGMVLLNVDNLPSENPADINGDGVVDVNDLLLLIGAWGPCEEPCPPCVADVNQDCTVDVNDLLLLIGGWGP